MKRILQLMPARPGWSAIYWHPQEQDKNYKNKAYHVEPLECWALVEDEDGDTEITGTIMADWECGPHVIDNIEEHTFVSYSHPEVAIDWQESAVKARNDYNSRVPLRP